MKTSAIHGGLVFEAATALGRPWQEIIDFSANINPLGQPPGLEQKVMDEFSRSLHYPEVKAESMSLRLAELTGLGQNCFLPGAGSTPHFHLLAQGLKLTRPLIVAPAFAEYEEAMRRSRVRVEHVITTAEDDWRVTSETLSRIWTAEPDAIFVAQPANPTGRLVPRELFLELAEEAQKRDIWLLADEAFIDFTEDSCTLLPLVEKNRKIIVFRSLTKIYALPGLRLAYLAAHPQTVAPLAELMEPWPLSSPALSAAHFCLSQPWFKEETRQTLRTCRSHLAQSLTELDLGRVFPTEANFMLVKLKESIETQALLAHLFQDGILVRDASNFKGLELGYLRLAVRPEPEISALLASLSRFLKLKP